LEVTQNDGVVTAQAAGEGAWAITGHTQQRLVSFEQERPNPANEGERTSHITDEDKHYNNVNEN
jgi:hypothetical protein